MSSVLQTSVPLVTPCVQVLALGTENKNKKMLNLKKAVSRNILKKSRFGREMQSTNFQQLCVFKT